MRRCGSTELLKFGHIMEIDPGKPALITFTTGSTGAPKASARSHAFLTTQHDVLRRHM